jgi:hypothetical protein
VIGYRLNKQGSKKIAPPPENCSRKAKLPKYFWGRYKNCKAMCCLKEQAIKVLRGRIKWVVRGLRQNDIVSGEEQLCRA